MARRNRCSDAGYVYPVLNRAAGRATLLDKPADYAAFEKVVRQIWERSAMRLLSYVVMPNHWSFPVQEDDHYFTVCRYVERNLQRANRVARAEHGR